MARSGPPKTPTKLKKARGTHRADRDLPGAEPVASKSAPKIPFSVECNPAALDCWKRTTAALKRMGILSADDGLALEALCMAQATCEDGELEIKLNGLTIIGSHGGRVANPAVAIVRNARAQVHRLSVEFGLTPAARTRVRAEKAPEKPNAKDAKDPKKNPDAFLFGGQSKVVGRIGA